MDKKISLVYVVFFSLLLSGTTSVVAEAYGVAPTKAKKEPGEIKTVTHEPNPNSVKFGGYVIRPDLSTWPKAQYLTPDTLVALGFSPKGDFAYVYRTGRQECGPDCQELIIQDLRTDQRTIWSRETAITNLLEGWAQFSGGTSNKVSPEAMKQIFLSKDISIGKPLGPLVRSLLKENSDEFSVELKTKSKGKEFRDQSVEVYLNSLKKGKKQIALLDQASLEDWRGNPASLRFMGFLKSPVSRHAVVILEHLSSDMGDAYPSKVIVTPVGVNLETGFKK